MSAPPENRTPSEEKDEIDDVDPDTGEAETGTAPSKTTPKRKRGRPPGSKNKKTIEKEKAAVDAGTSSETPVKRPRGRPPKRKPEDEKKTEGESSGPPVKKKRGRPPKNPRPEPTTGGDEGEPSSTVESPPKRKRGRPRKDST